MRRYVAQSVGQSQDGSQWWLNWVIRDKPSGLLVGFAQAAVEGEAGRLTTGVAWVVAPQAQGLVLLPKRREQRSTGCGITALALLVPSARLAPRIPWRTFSFHYYSHPTTTCRSDLPTRRQAEPALVPSSTGFADSGSPSLAAPAPAPPFWMPSQKCRLPKFTSRRRSRIRNFDYVLFIPFRELTLPFRGLRSRPSTTSVVELGTHPLEEVVRSRSEFCVHAV